MNEGAFMALPIAATPVLKGKEARKFYEDMKKDATKIYSEEELRSVEATFKKVMRRNPEMRKRFGVSDDI
jgi:hypothetical protein